ncbi:MAG TPA: SAM-dependent methyltransferase [Streptosporangiaceae bacterium]|nr:SAM-dependent methyltransferase [Streptosporangiaceae bacterium]
MDFAFWRRRWRRAPGAGSAAAPAAAPDVVPDAGGEAGRISRTSQAVALTRAQLDRPHSPEGDPLAQARLCAGMRPTPIDRLRPMLTARTRFFDEAVTAALADGTDQVVICGAGYDDRALRFRTSGVRFYELDQGPTQADKRRRLMALGSDLSGLTLARADFRTHDVAAVLAGHGHDRARPTLFLCEGLLVYLDEPALVRLLSGLASGAAPGSRLAASLAVHAEGLATAEVVAAANARRRAGPTEPWRTILPRDEQLALLARAGWRTDQAVDAADLEASAPPGRNLLVLAHPDR